MSEPKATIGRRQLLRAGMTGLFVATASALEPGTAAADTETNFPWSSRPPVNSSFFPTNRCIQ